MRAAVYALLCLTLLLVRPSALSAAGLVGADESALEASVLPVQAAQPGVLSVVMDLRAMRLGSALRVLTYFPQGFSPAVDKSLIDFAETLHTDAYAEVLERSELAFERDLSAALSARDAGGGAAFEQNKGDVFFNVSTYSISYPADKESGRYFSILFKQDMGGGGGAHANHLYRTISFDRAGGAELTLADVFPGRKNVEIALARLAMPHLPDKGKGMDEQDMDVDMHRIILVPEGVRIIYAPYEMGSYSKGDITINILLKELLPLGVNQALWQAEKADK